MTNHTLQQQRFRLAERNLCVHCESDQIVRFQREYADGGMAEQVVCRDCHSEWWQSYNLCAVGEPEIPEEEAADHWSSPNGCHPDCPACAAERRSGT